MFASMLLNVLPTSCNAMLTAICFPTLKLILCVFEQSKKVMKLDSCNRRIL